MRTARTRTESRTGDDRRQQASTKFEAGEARAASSEPVALSGEEETGGPAIGNPKKVESVEDETMDALSALRAAKKRARDEFDDHE